MLTDIKLKASPTSSQKLTLSQWMGCVRLVWNAKVAEEKYYSVFACKYYKKSSTKAYLEESVIGIDRGVAIAVHAGFQSFDFSSNQKKSMTKSARYIKRLQRKMARQKLTSNRRKKTKYRIAKYHAKKAKIRNDFAHKTSRALVNSKAKVFVCGRCENADNADHNASLVIKKWAINLILDTGTVLSDKGVLIAKSDSVRGGNRKTSQAKSSTSSRQRSVKKKNQLLRHLFWKLSHLWLSSSLGRTIVSENENIHLLW